MQDDLIQMLQDENDTLRERIRQLEEMILPTGFNPPVEWALTAHEARVFAHLTTREIATKQSIMDAVYHDRIGEEPSLKIIDVFVHKIRKKLKPYGVVINTVWGQGYTLVDRERFLPAADREAAA